MRLPVVTTTLKTRHEQEILVARDDLLTGGTKERALREYLRPFGDKHFLYASPFSGYAQIALAHVCREFKLNCTIVAELDPSTNELHPYSLRAREMGAEVLEAKNLNEAEETAKKISLKADNFYKIPLGFNDPEFRSSMARVLGREWASLNERVPGGIRRVWLPVGSGTLISAFMEFLTPATEILALNVRVLTPEDQRIMKLKTSSRITMRDADRPFHSPATVLPEIPSNVFYDAKLWTIVDAEGLSGDLWWNVAG